jgi:anti-anti-sigma factor
MPIAAPLEMTSQGPDRTIALSHEHLEDSGTGDQISSHLHEMAGDEESERADCQLSLDLRGVRRITSNGLNELIGINRLARNRGVRLVLLDVQESVRDVFAITRLERMFEFSCSTAEA